MKMNSTIYAFLLKKGREEDKQKHFLYSLILFLVFSLVMSMIGAFILTFLIGLIKEIWDHYYGSGFCWYDMTANLLGIFFAVLTGFLFVG